MSQHHKLSEILHYDLSEKKGAQLKKGLYEYQFLINALSHAIQHLKNGNYEKFDALVGENACQIRAVKIAIMAKQNNMELEELQENISNLFKKIKSLLLPEEIHSLMGANISLKQVLSEQTLELLLTPDQMYFLQSFLLSEIKIPYDKKSTSILTQDKTHSKNLKKYGEISTSFAASMGRKLRRLLSQSSVNVVKELAWDLGDQHLINITSDQFLYIHHAWPTLPMFWTYKTLLKSSLKEGIPILLRAKFIEKQGENSIYKDEEILFFKPIKGDNNLAYVCTEPDTKDLEISSYVIEGVVCIDENFCKMKWREEITDYNIMDIVLAGAADHRQYPDPDIKVDIKDTEYENYIRIAKEKGFCLENPSTFFINHVYPIQVKKAFSYIEEEKFAQTQ